MVQRFSDVTVAQHDYYRPFSIPNPADAGCNSDLAQYSNTPSLRAAGFEDEDDDEDENEAPCEGELLWFGNPGLKPRAES